mmetsp:Transcript_21400/g.33260  ORF Transcript_21400/g.33260 Transcript_21400/m.33260 type:complete len:201 (+) Transcript_21400:206-808(+)
MQTSRFSFQRGRKSTEPDKEFFSRFKKCMSAGSRANDTGPVKEFSLRYKIRRLWGRAVRQSVPSRALPIRLRMTRPSGRFVKSALPTKLFELKLASFIDFGKCVRSMVPDSAFMLMSIRLVVAGMYLRQREPCRLFQGHMISYRWLPLASVESPSQGVGPWGPQVECRMASGFSKPATSNSTRSTYGSDDSSNLPSGSSA